MIEVIYFLFVVVAYMFPSIIAFKRRHKNFLPIVLVNFFLGWTLLGWFICLVWSTTSNIHRGDQ